MSKIKIFTDSGVDLPFSVLIENEVEILPIYYRFNQENIVYGDDLKLSSREFFWHLQNHDIPYTMGCNPAYVYDRFLKWIQEGYDIICVSLSSMLSSSYNHVCMVKETLKEEYPKSNISVIDSKTGSLCQGLLLYKTIELCRKGLSIEEITEWLEKNKEYYHIEFFVDNLKYLTNGGRISKMGATIGNVLNIKPIVQVNSIGSAELLMVSRGIKAATKSLVENFSKNADTGEKIGIIHSDYEYGIIGIQNLIASLGIQYDSFITEINPVIASHIGPKALGLCYRKK